MNISEDLLCLYSATVEHEDDSYVLEVPEQEIQNGDLSDDEVYKIALIATSSDGTEATRDSSEREQTVESESGPPVDEGDIRKVEIEGLGDQGDGVGKIEGGLRRDRPRDGTRRYRYSRNSNRTTEFCYSRGHSGPHRRQI
jgi:hypothetical protein